MIDWNTIHDLLTQYYRCYCHLLIVQGDTSTVAVTSLIAFYEKIPVGHVEAGLRTYNLGSPFPEEGNRQIVSRFAQYNWAPTEWAANNLNKGAISNITDLLPHWLKKNK